MSSAGMSTDQMLGFLGTRIMFGRTGLMGDVFQTLPHTIPIFHKLDLANLPND